MGRSRARQVPDAATLLGGAIPVAALVALVRAAPPVELGGAALGWATPVAAVVVVAVGAVLGIAALVAGLRRGSVAALLGCAAAAAVSGAALALALTGSRAPFAIALPIAAVLGAAALLAGRYRPAVPGRRNRWLIAAAGLILAEAAVVTGAVPEVASAVEPIRAAPLLAAAALLTGVALVTADRWRAAAAMAAALAAGSLAVDRGATLELGFGLAALAAAGVAGVRAVAAARPGDPDAVHEELPDLARHLPEGVLAFDGRLTLRSWNAAASRLLALDDGAVGTPLTDLLGVSVGNLPIDDGPRIVDGVAGLMVRLHRTGDGILAIVGEGPVDGAEERLGRELRGTIEELLQARRTIDLQRAELERLTAIDPLTGVASRGAIIERLRTELAQARRYAHPVSVVLLDIDRFSEINARHGVAGGDALLREVALRIRLRVREADALGRSGSDGFLAILPHTDEAGAAMFADALRTRLAQRPLPLGREAVPITVSVGVAVVRAGETLDLDGLLARVDEALDSARAAGGDRIALDRLHGLARLDDRRIDHRDEEAHGTR